MAKACPVCGKSFNAPPSGRVTCSKECGAVQLTRSKIGRRKAWSEEAKERLAKKGKSPNLVLGNLAAQKSPKVGRFESNINAKIWTIVSPSGEEIAVQNLREWARNNCGLFDKPSTDRAAYQICSGFTAIAQTMSGYRGGEGNKRRGSLSYFGWTLKEPPINQD